MFLDIAAAVLIIAFFIRGYRKGLVIAVFSLLSILIGIVCALKLSHFLAVYLSDKHILTSAWAPLLSYIIIFLIVVWLVRIGASLIAKAMDAIALGIFNKLSGGILYAAIAVILWSSLLWLFSHAQLVTTNTIAHSKTYPYFLPVAPWVFENIGRVFPFCKGLFVDLQFFFDRIQHLPKHVGTH